MSVGQLIWWMWSRTLQANGGAGCGIMGAPIVLGELLNESGPPAASSDDGNRPRPITPTQTAHAQRARQQQTRGHCRVPAQTLAEGSNLEARGAVDHRQRAHELRLIESKLKRDRAA
jgi:hypothetical protein